MKTIDLFKNLMIMAAADRKFTEGEVALLTARSSRWGLSDAEFQEALEYALSPDPALTLPDSHEDRVRMLQNLLQVMAADGELAPVERQLFAEASARMGIAGDELNRLIDELVGRCCTDDRHPG